MSSRRPRRPGDRPSDRPGARRPARQPGQTPRGGRPAPVSEQRSGPTPRRARFTNRAAVLAIVFAVLIVSYASSMKAYVNQRERIADLAATIAQSEDQIAVAEREKRRWKDPAFVEAQARARFGWVLPGETAYQVIGPDGEPLGDAPGLTDPDEVAPPDPIAWWTTVAVAVDMADHPEAYVEPTPPKRIRPEPTEPTAPARP